jgi:AcrR family transcriptional regulator
MPKVVDRQLRRTELAAAAATVLANEGLAGFTTRRIAEEAGVSKGILNHYFDDKAELFIAVLELFYERVEARMHERARGLTGVAALRVAMFEALPIDDVRREEAVAEISFAAASVSDPALRLWYRRQRNRFRVELAGHLDAAVSAGEMTLHVTPQQGADALLAFMDSISLQSVLGGDDLGEAEQLAALDRSVDALRAR